MTTQPEALKLADELDMWTKGEPAAAELRRLHEAHDWQHRMAGDRLRRIEKLEAVNQELLAALEKLARLGNGEHYGNSDGNMIARAAIAKGEAK
jgi:hypothetical protein